MNISRRTSAKLALAAAPLALLSLTAGTCSNIVPPTPTQTAAAVAALQGVITATQNLIAAGGLTPANLAAAQAQVSALTAQIAALTAGSPISSVFTNVTNILNTLAQYVPSILAVIGMLARPAGAIETSDQAHLRTGVAVLRALAGA